MPRKEGSSSGKLKIGDHWNVISIIALLIGAVTLALGILAEHEKEQLDELRKQQHESQGFTIAYKDHQLSFGKKLAEEESPSKIPEYPPFQIATWTAGIFGLVFAPFAWMRERRKILCYSAIAFCLAGLAWHYVAIAIAVVVILLLLMLLC